MALNFCEFHKKISIRENIIVNMSFPYILTLLRLRVMRLILNIIFGGVMTVLAY